MALPGVDPFDPTPIHRRQLLVAQGTSPGDAPELLVLMFGNKTSAGSETVEVLGLPIETAADAEARMGTRSELFAGYKKFVEVDPAATISFIAVTESGGVASDVDFTFTSGPASAATNVKIEAHGETVFAEVQEGDSVSDIAAS